MVHFHKHLHSAVSFYSISFCNTNTYTIFFRSRIRLYCISFEVNFYSVCRNAFRFQCFSNILGTSLGQLKVYCYITCIYICITCYANAYGVGYDFDDKRIKSVVLELANQDAKDYVTLSATDFTKTDKVVISKKASQTPIVTPPVCEVNVIITDKWGRQTTETVYVKVLK